MKTLKYLSQSLDLKKETTESAINQPSTNLYGKSITENPFHEHKKIHNETSQSVEDFKYKISESFYIRTQAFAINPNGEVLQNQHKIQTADQTTLSEQGKKSRNKNSRSLQLRQLRKIPKQLIFPQDKRLPHSFEECCPYLESLQHQLYKTQNILPHEILARRNKKANKLMKNKDSKLH